MFFNMYRFLFFNIDNVYVLPEIFVVSEKSWFQSHCCLSYKLNSIIIPFWHRHPTTLNVSLQFTNFIPRSTPRASILKVGMKYLGVLITLSISTSLYLRWESCNKILLLCDCNCHFLIEESLTTSDNLCHLFIRKGSTFMVTIIIISDLN
jgi:hypothetical protein